MVTTHQRHRPRGLSRAFTLIELMVVTGIIVVVTGVILANNNRFGGVVLLQNLTYDVALSIRQAQIYGISVARFGADPTFSSGYGVDFDLANSNAYTLFADVSNNGLYDCTSPGSGGCELVGATTIASGYSIASLCATAPGGAETCTGITKLDILFRRPEPDAWISANGISCVLQSSDCEESGRVVLQSPRGDTMTVLVDANGQISVENGTVQ